MARGQGILSAGNHAGYDEHVEGELESDRMVILRGSSISQLLL